MERRLQILLDEDRYRRVAAEAESSGRSVAAVIREAIDRRFPDDGDAARMAAARRFLERTAHPDEEPMEDPAELKRIYDADLLAKFERMGL